MGRTVLAGMRIATTVMAAAFLALAVPLNASAHPAHDGVMFALLEAEVVEGRTDAVALNLIVMNSSDAAATFSSLTSPDATRVVLERRGSFLGFEFWRTVTSLRLDPGEVVRLSAPEYRVIAETRTPRALLEIGVALQADFGPLGVVEAWDFR